MLARRELSVGQVRERLLGQGHAPETIETAVTRLVAERALDDHRTARAVAQTAVQVRQWPRARIMEELARRRIEDGVARAAVDEVFADVDERALLDGLLDRRLASGDPDPRQVRRLHRSLVRRGFSTEDVTAALEARLRGRGLLE